MQTLAIYYLCKLGTYSKGILLVFQPLFAQLVSSYCRGFIYIVLFTYMGHKALYEIKTQGAELDLNQK